MFILGSNYSMLLDMDPSKLIVEGIVDCLYKQKPIEFNPRPQFIVINYNYSQVYPETILRFINDETIVKDNRVLKTDVKFEYVLRQVVTIGERNKILNYMLEDFSNYLYEGYSQSGKISGEFETFMNYL